MHIDVSELAANPKMLRAVAAELKKSIDRLEGEMYDLDKVIDAGGHQAEIAKNSVASKERRQRGLDVLRDALMAAK